MKIDANDILNELRLMIQSVWTPCNVPTGRETRRTLRHCIQTMV
uniref:Uncharacterized protein n=1 Tax=Rhizophora mucronata TaxID=61149 RepID=A0A2P2KCS8_RHIMU